MLLYGMQVILIVSFYFVVVLSLSIENAVNGQIINEIENGTTTAMPMILVPHDQSRTKINNNFDDYVARNQKACFETHSFMSCIKYKASKIIWKFATNSFGYFPSEQGREISSDGNQRRIRIIQLMKPVSEPVEQLFDNARSAKDDSEWLSASKFLKRSLEAFGQNHGVQLTIAGDSGLRITGLEAEPRGRHEKKKKKWLVILPLIILMKIAHLKMTMVSLLFGVLGLNVLLVGGVAWLIHYLKFKTLCKIHPHLVQSHSHVYDSDPAEYSSFVGSSFPGSYHSASGSGTHEINAGSYSKDWANKKAYNGYNYLDTISKRI